MGLGTSPIDITLINDCGMQIIHIEKFNDRNFIKIEQGIMLNQKVTITPDARQGSIGYVLLGKKKCGL